jgi:glycosyltransferase involved in cell wall biosynthesis
MQGVDTVNSPANILVINHYAGSPKHGMEYRPYYVGREWVRLGHQVTVVAASYSHLRISAPECTGRVSEEWIEGIRYLWYPTPSYQGNGLGRARNIFSFVRQVWLDARRLARAYRPQLVIASSTYPFDIHPARRIARASGAKLVYEVQDLWPLTPIEVGGMSPWHPFIMLMQSAEDYAYRHVDHVVSVLPKTIDHMCAHGLDRAKFHYVPNGIACDEWKVDDAELPPEHRRALDQARAEGRFVLGYAGGHAITNALDTLIDAAQFMQTAPVSVVLVGAGTEKQRLQEKAGKLGLPNIVFLPPLPKPLIPSLLHQFDACYLGWTHCPLYRFGVGPNKLIDYLMSGRPVIHAVDAGNDLVAEAGCGVSVPPENPQAVADAVTKLLNMTAAERSALGQRGRDHAMRYHEYGYLARQYLEAVA